MSVTNIDNLLSDLDINDAEELRNKLSKDIIQKRKYGNMSITVFVPAKLKKSFMISKAWAHEKKLIETTSNYAFAKFAVTNTIKLIIGEIERERNAPPEQPKIPEVLQEPN